MGIPSSDNAGRTDDAQESDRVRLESFFANQPADTSENGVAKHAPPRPSREPRRTSVFALDLLDVGSLQIL